jgi:hypothetical protein
MGIQKQINRDYSVLVRDYGRLGVELMRKPIARYILGGVAIATLAPFVARLFRNPEVQTFVRDNVEGIRSRIEGVVQTGEDTMDASL